MNNKKKQGEGVLSAWFFGGRTNVVSALLVILVIVIGAVFSLLFSKSIENRLIQDLVDTSVVHIHAHAEADLVPGNWIERWQEPESERHFMDYFEEMKTLPEVVRLNLFNTEGVLVWSNFIENIGQKPENETVGRALRGEEFFGFANPKGETAARTGNKRLLEIYIPVHDMEMDKVIGIAESYNGLKRIDQYLFLVRVAVWSFTLGTIVIIMVLLRGAYRRVNQQISREVAQRTSQLTTALSESRKLSQIVENTFEAIALVDLGKENLLRYVNPAWQKMFGYTFDEVVNKKEGLILDAAQHAQNQKQSLEKAVAAGTTLQMEMEWKRKDGSLVPVEVVTMPIRDQDDRIVLWLNTVRDISERKKSEARVAELNELRRKFITIISHQLRTPLSSIRWNLESLIAGEMGKLKVQQYEFVRLTYQASLEVIRRIRDLLFVMDIEEGRLALNKTSTSIEALWRSVFAEVVRQCQVKELKCSFEKPISPLADMAIDAERIRMVLEHLASNAVDYTRPGGKITSAIKPIADGVRFEISDTGIGIPIEEQKRMFVRFFRASNAAVMKPDANGIGLSICKFIVEQHGGKIGFESAEGKGSTFWFELPIS